MIIQAGGLETILLKRGETVGDSKKEDWEIFEGKESKHVQKGRKINDDGKDFLQNEIVEVGLEDNEGVSDIYSNEACNLERRDSYSRAVVGK